MNILLSIFLLPQLLIMYISFHRHRFALPMIKELMQKIPPDAATALNANIVVRIAGAFAGAIDAFYGFWFIAIPVFALVSQVLVYFLKKQSEAVAKVGVLLIMTFFATLAFISLSAQMMTLIMVTANYTR